MLTKFPGANGQRGFAFALAAEPCLGLSSWNFPQNVELPEVHCAEGLLSQELWVSWSARPGD